MLKSARLVAVLLICAALLVATGNPLLTVFAATVRQVPHQHWVQQGASESWAARR